MEVGRRLLSSHPPSISRTHHRNLISPSSASRVIISTSTTSAVQHFPSSILMLEQHNGYKNSHTQDKHMAREFLDLQGMEDSSLSSEETEKHHFVQYLRTLECQLLSHPRFWYSFLTTRSSGNASLMMQTDLINNKFADPGAELMPTEQDMPCTMSPEDVISLAKRALAASHNAALLAEKSHKLIDELVGKTQVSCLDHSGPTNESITVGKKVVRSKRLMERQSKKRKLFRKSEDFPSGTYIPVGDKTRRIEKSIDNNDPLRLFLWGPETKQLLTIKEEKDLFAQIQYLMELEAIKNKLHVQFGREPTLVEWAQAVGMSCQGLQTFISSGTRSRHRMIYANFRLVIHIAKQYEGKGLNIQDLLQVGSMGLMKSLEKFKPEAGSRFPTYAYWWIRQSIRKSIFLHSRTIRLPENVFAELKRIKDVKRLCLQEGRTPTNEEVSKRAGININKLDSLLKISKSPISIQGHAWMDQDVTLQEITADPEIEIPEVLVARQMMRQHVHSLLGVLSPRERKIIMLRFGILSYEPKTLSEIGDMYGISQERVRQLQSEALKKLKACCSSHELEVYRELLV